MEDKLVLLSEEKKKGKDFSYFGSFIDYQEAILLMEQWAVLFLFLLYQNKHCRERHFILCYRDFSRYWRKYHSRLF